MADSKKIALNSIYIYIGVIASTLISLLTVPILLHNLGECDYGLFNLLAGVIAMLSFVKSAMIVTVQRFMNVAYGTGDLSKVRKIYTISLYIYLVVGIIIVLLIELLSPFVTNGYLNIENSRLDAAVLLFQVLVISTFFTTISIPFDALFNVYEEMWIFSFCNIIDGAFRLILAIVIGYLASYDKLVFYAFGMVIIAVFIFAIKYIVCKKRYVDIRLIGISKSDISIVKDLFSFIGWNLYSTLARLFSNQGYAIVLNLFVGTTINAAYGIANQINSTLNNFTSSVEKAFNPQIMKSEGNNNRIQVIDLSLLSTKYCSLMFSLFAIPLLVTLPYVLDIWLKTPPGHTIAFSRIIICASMISMLSVGITSIFYATGNIKQYLLWVGTILIVNVFVAYALMKIGFSVDIVVGLFIFIEVILLFVRLHYARALANMKMLDYFKTVFLPYIKVALPTLLVVYFIPCNGFLSFLGICILSCTLYIALLYSLGLDYSEKTKVKELLRTFKHNFNRR